MCSFQGSSLSHRRVAGSLRQLEVRYYLTENTAGYQRSDWVLDFWNARQGRDPPVHAKDTAANVEQSEIFFWELLTPTAGF